MKNSKYKILSIALAFAVANIASLVNAQAEHTNSTPGQLSKSDYKFACEAASGGAMEVELGKIASEKATHPDVKKFGERMVTDHTKAGEKLKQIASSKGAMLPERPSAEQQKEIDRLKALSGTE